VGFSLPSSSVPALRERLIEYATSHLTEESLDPALMCDAYLPLDQIGQEIYSAVQRLHPTGMDNEDPIFIASGARVACAPRVLKERHIKLQLATGKGDRTVAALGWRWAERVAGMGIGEGSMLDLAYRLRYNDHPEYGGVELEIQDLQLH
jgi:single-stranded-DNA-specific exonuclease